MAARLGGADLAALQNKAKRDPEGYVDEFELQRRHFLAELSLFKLHPQKNSEEFAELVMFMAQVAASYPKQTANLPQELMELLENNAAVLTPTLRKTLAQALIMLRNRKQVGPTQLLPLFFRLFRCRDKELHQLIFRHIIADIAKCNKRKQDEALNKALLGFLRENIENEEEFVSKKSLAIIAEMYRRNIWRNSNAVNVLACGAKHPSSSILNACLNFFLGNEVEDDPDDSSDEEEEEEKDMLLRASNAAAGVAGPSKREIYAAYKKGTFSTKKKKQAKLKRVMMTVKKQARREAQGEGQGGIAALHLLHDPQGFADQLFARLNKGAETFETRLKMLQVISRTIGVHKLILLQFYPFVQKYMMPQQREVTLILASLAQATHDMVPPDVLEPVLRQLVNNFIHDRARPEVVQVGLKSVRELCARQPLIISDVLLQDLASYKTDKIKGVRMAARSLISLFRSVAPQLLHKKDRGRAVQESLLSNGAPKLQPYGGGEVPSRIPGVELLESDGHASQSEEDDSEVEDGSDSDLSSGSADAEYSFDERSEHDSGISEEEAEELPASRTQVELEEVPSKSEVEKEGTTANGTEVEENCNSLRSLKIKVAEIRSEKSCDDASKGLLSTEMLRTLTPEDFSLMKRRKQERLLEAQMQKHGLKSTAKSSEGKSPKLHSLHEKRVAPEDLGPTIRVRQEKSMRLAKVYEGREGREFGASAKFKHKKEGGRSNKEKEKAKALPAAARLKKAKARIRNKGKGKLARKKQFTGKKKH